MLTHQWSLPAVHAWVVHSTLLYTVPSMKILQQTGETNDKCMHNVFILLYMNPMISVMKKDFISCHLTRISTRVILGINYVKGTKVKLRCQACVGIERWLEPSHKFVMTLKSPLRTKMTETASFLSQEPTCSCVAWFSK
jgi:hypothetical protein